MTIGVVVVTLNAKHHLPHNLPQLLNSSLKPRVLVVDSSSTDGTVELARKFGAETLIIPRNEFNHGTTREKARRYLNTDIVVMLTQDAYAVDNDMIEHLTRPIIEKKASVAYARQIPHDLAGFFETFHRHFNYPDQCHIRGKENSAHYGAYTVFCSNSCAAYLNTALDEIGGFKHVLIGEDTLAVADLLHRGHKIAYVAKAKVKHSHHYRLIDEFKRYFDTGLARRMYQQQIGFAGRDEKRGLKYVSEMLKHVTLKKPYLLPYALMNISAKFLGYHIGRHSQNAPLWFKKALSSQKHYWK